MRVGCLLLVCLLMTACMSSGQAKHDRSAYDGFEYKQATVQDEFAKDAFARGDENQGRFYQEESRRIRSESPRDEPESIGDFFLGLLLEGLFDSFTSDF